MSLLRFPGGFMCPYLPDFAASSPGFINSTLNSGTARVAFIFLAPKDGTIDWFEYRQGTNTTPPTNGIRFALQSLSGNDPDGTDLVWCDVTTGFGAGVWHVPPHALTNDGTSGGTKLTVTTGQQIAAVLSLPSYVAGSVTMSYLDLQNTLFSPTLVQYGDVFAAAWTRNFNTGCIALKYTDGYEPIAPNVFPIKTLSGAVTFNDTSTPDEVALRFLLTANAYISGAVVRVDLDAAADVVLYSGTTVIAGPMTLNGGRSSANGGYAFVPFPTTALAANTVYRLALKPTTGSNITYYSFDVEAAGVMAAAPGGVEWIFSHRTDAGAWSDVNTRRLWAAIVIAGVDSVPLGAEVSEVFAG